jgi:hypothetical protein
MTLVEIKSHYAEIAKSAGTQLRELICVFFSAISAISAISALFAVFA